jgi:spermidine synthase
MTSKTQINENLHQCYGQHFVPEKILYQGQTPYQEIIIFTHPIFGKVMMLDGIVQTTSKDEFTYHEMFAHVPLFAHPKPENILIIGGGDGGLLREVLRHKVSQVTMVELDEQVVTLSKQYLPELSQNAFDDPRVNLMYADGIDYIRQSNPESFDVILVDSTDPIGPGEVLFSKDFYQICRAALKNKGILITQNSVSFLQRDNLVSTMNKKKSLFKLNRFYQVDVPTYIGGCMNLSFASETLEYQNISLEMLEQRYKKANIPTRYYNPSLHLASFMLPNYLLQALQNNTINEVN